MSPEPYPLEPTPHFHKRKVIANAVVFVVALVLLTIALLQVSTPAPIEPSGEEFAEVRERFAEHEAWIERVRNDRMRIARLQSAYRINGHINPWADAIYGIRTMGAANGVPHAACADVFGRFSTTPDGLSPRAAWEPLLKTSDPEVRTLAALIAPVEFSAQRPGIDDQHPRVRELAAYAAARSSPVLDFKSRRSSERVFSVGMALIRAIDRAGALGQVLDFARAELRYDSRAAHHVSRQVLADWMLNQALIMQPSLQLHSDLMKPWNEQL